MATPLLSAAIIVKDEADFLRRCLASISEVCDEVVVVDTGSTDDSVAVARSFGAVEATRPWDDDFAAARNAALDLATGQWILYIDADEQLDECDPAELRAELAASTESVALRVWFRTRPIWSPYREYRLWRHRPDIRFVGRIHETMVPDLLRIEAEEGLTIGETDLFRLTHHGYEGDQIAKHRRNLPMLEQRVRELPDRVYLWNHLGNIREELGDIAGAQAAWLTGVEVVRRLGIVDRTDVLCFAGLGLSLIANGEDVSALIAEMQWRCPWYRTLDWMAAKNHVTQRRHHHAVPHLHALLATGVDPLDDSLAYNNAMFTTWAWDLLVECQLALGDLTGALATLTDAADANPADLGYRTKAIALRARAGRVG